MKTRTIDPCSSFTESLQRTDKQDNSDSQSEDESVEAPSLNKIEQAYDPDANNSRNP